MYIVHIDDRFTDKRTKNRMNRIRYLFTTLFFGTSIPLRRENNSSEIVKTIDFGSSVEVSLLVLRLWYGMDFRAFNSVDNSVVAFKNWYESRETNDIEWYCNHVAKVERYKRGKELTHEERKKNVSKNSVQRY